MRSMKRLLWTTRELGEFGTTGYRMYLVDEASGKDVSLWHDVPLRFAGAAKNEVNFVCEIPKGTDEKMEISLEESGNPILQDVGKDGKPRRIIYSKKPWNYGYVPQTWEDPAVRFPGTAFPGDGDPVDVVELGARSMRRGEVAKVRIVSALALIDEGEIDWKLIAMSLDDERAGDIRTLDDLLRHVPTALDEVREWYRIYKIAEGKPGNQYMFDGEPCNAELCVRVIEETHEQWQRSHKPK
jgi:inorganic pyrophosphatase